MNINSYLKQKLKEKNVHLEDLIQQSGSSKSTIYRVMTGLQKPSTKLRNKIIKILELNPSEQQELLYYISITDVDKNLVEAREAVYDFLFAQKSSLRKSIELVYYDVEKYVRSFEHILERLMERSKEKNFSCGIKVINCLKKDIISPLATTMEALSANESSCTVEHLISFSTHDYKENIKTLASIAPLLTLENYILKYRESENVSNYGFFHDFMILNYSYEDEHGKPIVRNLYLSFLCSSLSSCYVINEKDKNANEFFNRNYDSIEERYQSALSSRNNLTEYIATIRRMYVDYEVSIFRPHIGLSRVPMEVYQSILKRTSVEEFVKYFLHDGYDKEKLDVHIEELSSCAQSILEATYINKQIDVFTKSGLETFASTGSVNDHLNQLPAFNQAEVKMILENLKARDLNVKDPLNFFIVAEDYADPNLSLAAMDDGCLLIERYVDGSTSYAVIEHKKLSHLFADFAQHYVPPMMAIPQKEAHEFIDYLIEKYC